MSPTHLLSMSSLPPSCTTDRVIIEHLVQELLHQSPQRRCTAKILAHTLKWSTYDDNSYNVDAFLACLHNHFHGTILVKQPDDHDLSPYHNTTLHSIYHFFYCFLSKIDSSTVTSADLA